MPLQTNNFGISSNDVLDERAAARYLGFLTRVFNQWVTAELLPGPSIDGKFWTTIVLNAAIKHLERVGFRYIPNAKPTQYIPLPNVHRTFVVRSDETKSYHFKRRGVRGPIYGEPGSPQFMRELIAKEREFAAAKLKSVRDCQEQPPSGTAEFVAPSVHRSGVTQARARTISPPLAPAMIGRPKMVPAGAVDQPSASRLNTAESNKAEEFLTEEEIVTRYRGAISLGTLKNWRHRKIGPPWVRVGRTALYPHGPLLAWERDQTFNLAVAADDRRL